MNNKGVRQSNIELLRIVAMCLVLVVHTCFYSFGEPSHDTVVCAPLESFLRIAGQAFSVVCVNVFVMISGWFGIHPRWKGLASFLYQCAFIATAVYGILMMTGMSFTWAQIKHDVIYPNSYWFVYAYLWLYLLAPILNRFMETAPRREVKRLLIAFFLFQTLYGCWPFELGYIGKGYSPLSFIGLYLLTRYVRIYQPSWSQCAKQTAIGLYASVSLLPAVVLYAYARLSTNTENLSTLYRCFLSYTSPLVIAASLYLLLYFSKIRFQSQFINYIASSAFAIYLVHCHPSVLGGFFKQTVLNLHTMNSLGMFYFKLSLFLAGVFLASILLDKLRILSYRLLLKGCHRLFSR